MVHFVWRGNVTVLVALNGRAHPSDAEWDAYCATGAALLNAPGGRGRVRALAFSDGAGPTARQRAQSVEMVGGRTVPWALVSSSRFARGIATALSWAIGGFRSFAPHQLRLALRYLEVSDNEIGDLMAALLRMNRKIGLEAVGQLEEPDLSLS